MATHKQPPGGDLREILMGILTLQEWQGQLVRDALDKLNCNESPVDPKAEAAPATDAP